MIKASQFYKMPGRRRKAVAQKQKATPVKVVKDDKKGKSPSPAQMQLAKKLDLGPAKAAVKQTTPSKVPAKSDKVIYTRKAFAAKTSKETRPYHKSSHTPREKSSSDDNSNPLFDEQPDDDDESWHNIIQSDRGSSVSECSETISDTLAELERDSKRRREDTSSSEEEFQARKTYDRWTPKRERRLCVLWEDEPFLYNTTHDDYRDSVKRRKTLERFAASLNMTYVAVKKRMRSFRTVYRKLMHAPSGSAGDRLTKKQKEILTICSFLRGHLRSKPTVSTLPKKKSKKVDSSDQESDMVCDDNEDHDKPGPSTKTPQKKEGSKKPKKDGNETLLMENISDCLSSVAGIVNVQKNPKPNTAVHPLDLWSQLLAMKLKELPAIPVEELKLKIDTMVFELQKDADNTA